MKNWKKRFFVLSEASLGYYKTVEVSVCVCVCSSKVWLGDQFHCLTIGRKWNP